MSGICSFYTDKEYRQKQSEITKLNWKLGKFDSLRKPLKNLQCKNPDCDRVFKVKQSVRKLFCSHSCAARINNKGRPRKRNFFCLYCNKELETHNYKYCSIKCQVDYTHLTYIKRWKSGEESGINGITTKSLSVHIRRYLFIKYEGKCSLCGWNKPNSVTGRVPLEVDHVNGDSNNNKEENLRLICPNCHSLSPNYKSLNKGRGRAWRTAKYLKGSVVAA